MPRFPLPMEPDSEGVVTFGSPAAEHIGGSLRLRPGDRLSGSLPGRILELEILEARPGCVRARVLYDAPEPPTPVVELTLLMALPKKRLLEPIIEKASEIGVAALQPVLAERCIVKIPEDRLPERLQRWQRAAEEAQKQRGRSRPLRILEPLPLSEAVAQGWDRLYVFHESAEELLRQDDAPPAGRVAALIGPEGGLTPDEVEVARRAGGVVRRLPTYVLRCETAATVVSGLLIAWPRTEKE